MPPEVAQQYQDVVQRSQWQRAQLEQGVLPSAGVGAEMGLKRGCVSGEGGTIEVCV